MLSFGKSHGLSVVKCPDLKEDMSFVAKGCGTKLDFRVKKILWIDAMNWDEGEALVVCYHVFF